MAPLEIIADQFQDAGKQFPNVQNLLIEWPSDTDCRKQAQEFLMNQAHSAPSLGVDNDGTICYSATLLSGAKSAGNVAMVYRWTFPQDWATPTQNTPDPTLYSQCGERYQTLATQAADLAAEHLPESASWYPNRCHRWTLALHELAASETRAIHEIGLDCTIRTLRDLFTQSAIVLQRLSEAEAIPAESDVAASRPVHDAATESRGGWMGDVELASALGVHSSQIPAFRRKLKRMRDKGELSLDDWQEFENRKRNEPQFHYRANAPAIVAMAKRYSLPK